MSVGNGHCACTSYHPEPSSLNSFHESVCVERGELELRFAGLTEAGRWEYVHLNESAPIVVRSACKYGFVTRVNASEFLPH